MQVNAYNFRQRLCVRASVAVFTLLLMMLLAFAPDVSAQENDPGTAPVRMQRGQATGQSTVRGRVLFDDTGRPARRVAVMLFTDLQHPAVRRTVTNRRGEFRFASLAAGTYFVVADAPGTVSISSGFRITDLGMMREGIDEDQVRVTVDGKREAQAEVRIRRGGSIGGKITYGDNEPVLGGRILLYRRQENGFIPFFIKPVLTDDRGVYRVEGLPSGDYFVGVVERNAGVTKALTGESPGLVAAYYPSAKGVQDAKAVQVSAGSEAKDINIRIAYDNLRSISGRVVWRSTGRPVRKGAVVLKRRDDPAVEVSFIDVLQNITPLDVDKTDSLMRNMTLMMSMMSTTPSMDVDAEGRWRFDDVPSGTYLISVFAPLPAKGSEQAAEGEQSEMDNALAADDRGMVSQRLELTVTDRDETDVKVELTEGGRISGEIITEDPPAPYALLTVEYEGSHSFLNFPSYAKRDGTFLIEGVPAGDVRLEVRLPPGSTHYVKSISAGGVDLLRNPLRVTDGSEVVGVRVTLARGRATLSGRTISEGGAGVGGAGVLLVPVDDKLWQSRGARIFGRSDAEGAFSISGPPGDYLVFTWGPKDDPRQSIEEYIRSRVATARRISLQPDEAKKVDLIVNRSNSVDKRD